MTETDITRLCRALPAKACLVPRDGPESVAYHPAPGRPREPVMRHLYYRDSYSMAHRDRGAEGRHGIPARFFVTALMVPAAIMVLASIIH
jgi:hypothetical protein